MPVSITEGLKFQNKDQPPFWELPQEIWNIPYTQYDMVIIKLLICNLQTSTNALLIHARTGPRVWILLEVTAVIVNLDILEQIARQVKR